MKNNYPRWEDHLAKCPRCLSVMELGFTSGNAGLSWIRREKLSRFVFVDEDLNKAGLRKYFPSSARYHLAYHCENCELVVVDYSRVISHPEAKKLAV